MRRKYSEEEVRQMDIKDVGMLLCTFGVTGEYRAMVQGVYVEKRRELRENV